MEKKTNKAKLETFKFLRKSAEIMPSMEIQRIYTYLGIFACRIHICNEKSAKT